MTTDAIHFADYDQLSVLPKLTKDFLFSEKASEEWKKSRCNENQISAWLNSFSFSEDKRKILLDVLHDQYQPIALHPRVKENIASLSMSNTLCVTTGHQLCVWGGPLYFFSKIAGTIAYCQYLNQTISSHHFVPVFWLASEDHDIAEIDHLFTFNKKTTWETAGESISGNLSRKGLEEMLSSLKMILPTNPNLEKWMDAALESTKKQAAWVDILRDWLHFIFGQDGLIILDPRDVRLKQSFASIMKQEVNEQYLFSALQAPLSQLEKDGYKIQVNPRPINLFYFKNTQRFRIMEETNGVFSLAGDDKSWSKTDLIQELNNHPERFSPNVILRPLYQQCILPNIVYLGGPAEIAYNLPLYSVYSSFNLSAPLLRLRPIVQPVRAKEVKRIKESGLHLHEVMQHEDGINRLLLSQIEAAHLPPSFNSAMQHLYQELADLVAQTDKSLIGTVESEKVKALKGIENIGQKLQKAIKTKEESRIKQIISIRDKWFPDVAPAERKENIFRYLSEREDFFIHFQRIIQENIQQNKMIFWEYLA